MRLGETGWGQQMAKMTKRERVLAAFDHQETDRVPLYDLMLNDDCIEYFTGVYAPYGEDGARVQAQAVDRMLDMARGVGVPPRQPPTDFTSDPVLLEWARYGALTYRKNPIPSYDAAAAWAKDQVQKLGRWREDTDLKQAAESTRRRFEKLYGWKFEGVIRDTLCMSKLFDPERPSHSLDSYGKQFNRFKPVHEDWSRYSPEMLHRCTEDVEINSMLYE